MGTSAVCLRIFVLSVGTFCSQALAKEPSRTEEIVVSAPAFQHSGPEVQEQMRLGAEEANIAIRSGHLKLKRFGLILLTPESMRHEQLLQSRYGLTMENLGCVIDDLSAAYVKAFNSVIEKELLSRYGSEFWRKTELEAGKLPLPPGIGAEQSHSAIDGLTCTVCEALQRESIEAPPNNSLDRSRPE